MTTLILDTSQSQTIVALSIEGKILDAIVQPHQTLLSIPLPLSIQTFLKKHELSPNTLTAIALGIGPGSYTGTRIAATVAKSLSISLEIPVITYPSLLAYIPQNHTGPCTFLMESKAGTPFAISATATEKGFEKIHIEQESLDASLFALNPQALLNIHPHLREQTIHTGSLNLTRLAIHLDNQLKNGLFIDYKKLSSIELLYLNKLEEKKAQVEALTVE